MVGVAELRRQKGYARPMPAPEHHIAFGPVPSRRLGSSLGINNVVAKTCSYCCIYCQVGATTEQRIEPRPFFTPKQVQAAVATRLRKIAATGAKIDFLTFVPDGEPTLDARLGDSIEALLGFGLPVAVITNGSLLWRAEVRRALTRADLVSVKVDTVDDAIWRRINRPQRELELPRVLEGIRQFAAAYDGTLLSDTTLIAGVNDASDSISATADFLAGIRPQTAYLAVPTRPTAVAGIRGTDESGLLHARRIFSTRLPRVETLAEHEIGEFTPSGDARGDLLAITAVHPMREDDVRRLLKGNHADWRVVQSLLSEGSLKAVRYQGQTFYLRPARCDRSAM